MNLATVTAPPMPVTPPANTKELKALKKACEQFEAVFAKQLLSEMRKGVQETSIGDQAGSDIYKDMMDQAIGDSMAHQGALGIGQMLYKEFAAQVAGGSAHGAVTAEAQKLDLGDNSGNAAGTATPQGTALPFGTATTRRE